MPKAKTKVFLLPNEIMELVFSHLPWLDLARITLVCKLWRELGEKPKLWKHFELVVNENNFAYLENTLCESKRFSQVRKLKMTSFLNAGRTKNTQISQEKTRTKIFKQIWQNRTLECLNISHHNLHCISPTLFSVFPSKLRSLRLESTGLYVEQTQALFSGLDTQNTLTDLVLESDDYTEVDTDMFARVVNKLDSFNLQMCCIENEQAEAVFSLMSKKSNLKRFSVNGFDLGPDFFGISDSEIDPEVLAISINKLEVCELCMVELRKNQIEKILNQVLVKTSLKSLVISIPFADGVEISKDLVKAVEEKLDNFQFSMYVNDE